MKKRCRARKPDPRLVPYSPLPIAYRLVSSTLYCDEPYIKGVPKNHGDQKVLVDADVAEIYGVETRDINKAVANNRDKFPVGYIVELSTQEKSELVENFHRFNKLKHSTVNPKAFPEKGLYMLATILKSPQAVQATLAIIETFSKIRHLSRNIQELSVIQDKADQKTLMQKSGEMIAELLDDDLQTTGTETSIELNFAVLKFKHTVKKKK